MQTTTPRPSFFRRNGILIVFGVLTLLSLAAHAMSGWQSENEQRHRDHRSAQPLAGYLVGGSFESSVFENWESEFLQMGLFVLMTVKLRQKGSSESAPLNPADEKHETFARASQPWPVQKGGLWLKLYEHSLSAALLLLFLASFIGHWIGSWRQHNEDFGDQAPISLIHYLFNAQLWFESMQNWQSEFLSVFAIVGLSIFLREKGSPQSKPVTAPNSKTGA